MPLVTKCILSEIDNDEIRISIMSRHTLNDGKTPNPNISRFTEWNKELAPNPRLAGQYYRNEIEWEDFARSYTESLHSPQKTHAVEELIDRAKQNTIVVMCIELSPERCHRRLLAEECKRRCPDLAVVVH